MSHTKLRTRMAISLVSVLASAAITACGGGSSDAATTQAAATDAVSATDSSVTSSVSAAASAGMVTTNVTAVADTASAATTATSGSTSVASTGSDAPTVVASTGTSSTTDTGTDSTDATAVTVAANDTNTVKPQVPRTPVTTVSRPTGNTGSGFFVAAGKLYDANGKEFRIRGMNHNHWDSPGTPTGLPLSGANTARVVLSFTNTTKYNWNIISTQILANKMVPMPGNWMGTCTTDPTVLSGIVDTWVAQASTWTQLNSNGLINIANEWGPANSTAWRDAYITAIARMRAAGYTGTLVVDSGGCGQDALDVVNYGAAVLASDPQKNILFDVHVYGMFYFPAVASWQQDYTKSMAQLKATGLPILIGEFGPGRNIGPSPTLITPAQVVATAEANGWGWMPWSWDDNNLASCQADDNWFSLTKNCGYYKTDADLTTFGKVIVPLLQATAAKATVFN